MKKALLALVALPLLAGPATACPITDWLDARNEIVAQLGGNVTIGAQDCKVVLDMVKVNKDHQAGVLREERNGGTSNFRQINTETDRMWTACKSWGTKKARYEAHVNGGWAPVGAPCADGLGTVEQGGFGPGKFCAF